MPPIPAPTQATDRDERSEACAQALKPAFDDVVARSTVGVSAAVGPELPEEFQSLAKDAESSGWSHDEAIAAIRSLAQELLGAQAATYD